MNQNLEFEELMTKHKAADVWIYEFGSDPTQPISLLAPQAAVQTEGSVRQMYNTAF